MELANLLRPDDLVVVNRTRVRHARLHGRKVGSGGVVEALLLRPLGEGLWRAMVRPARRLRPGSEIDFGELRGRICSDPVDGEVDLVLDIDGPDVEAVIARIGDVPLPPYIRSALEDPGRYQTMFADRLGSAAAPTAGLHFTPSVVDGLRRSGVEITAVDLEVGLATFRPIASDRIEDHVMHRERCSVGADARDAIARCRRSGGRVVAIGTTVVRTLETAATDHGVEAGSWETELYLRPGSPIRVVDLLVTNFHLPRSSLLVLVEAFMGPSWRNAYRDALDRGFRFLSFGDCMLAERLR